MEEALAAPHARDILAARRDVIAEQWYRAIAHSSFVPLSATEVRARLLHLVDEAIDVLLAESFDARRAQGIGESVARMHYIHADVAGGTVGVLGRELMIGLGPEHLAVLNARLADLLDELVSAYFRRSLSIILQEQEGMRNALLAGLRAAEQQLRQARDELEMRVEQRTEELAQANRDLRREMDERTQAELALRESEARWRSLVENAPDIVVTVDRHGDILFVNRMPEGSALRPEDLIGTNASGYAVPKQRQMVKRAIREIFEQGQQSALEVATITADGSVAWQAVRYGPIWRDGEVTAAMLVVRDISERKKLEEMKDNLIRDVSHELRTPLAKVQMSLELLQEIVADERTDHQRAIRTSEVATRSVRRLLETVEGILDLSRLESGTLGYRREAFSVEELAEEVIGYMRPLAQAKDLGLQLQRTGQALRLAGDREKLFRVLVNLIDNAIKFTDEGQVVVSLECSDGEVTVSVSDSGEGISPENLDRIFDRFFQARTTAPGVGIGLTICRTIVDAHGGRLWAESAGKGEGATFRVSFPAKDRP